MIKSFFTCFLLLTFHVHALMTDCNQLIVMTSHSWETFHGTLQCFERQNDGDWKSVSGLIPVVLGKNGMAWGKGLHPQICGSENVKKEGDGKSPAGLFSLGSAFGKLSTEKQEHIKMHYIPIKPSIQAVDDPDSMHYNTIVDVEKISHIDWKSSEKMDEIPLYDLGLVINHNFPCPETGLGSAIFMHIWRNESVGTAGCTAMDKQHLEEIVGWLDEKHHPCIIQLPLEFYQIVKSQWNLPNLPMSQ